MVGSVMPPTVAGGSQLRIIYLEAPCDTDDSAGEGSVAPGSLNSLMLTFRGFLKIS